MGNLRAPRQAFRFDTGDRISFGVSSGLLPESPPLELEGVAAALRYADAAADREISLRASA